MSSLLTGSGRVRLETGLIYQKGDDVIVLVGSDWFDVTGEASTPRGVSAKRSLLEPIKSRA